MEQTDTLLNGYKIIQDSERFQFGIDAVLLADFACAGLKSAESVIDLGTGTGIIPLLMAGKLPGLSLTGLEVQEASADMAADLKKEFGLFTGTFARWKRFLRATVLMWLPVIRLI